MLVDKTLIKDWPNDSLADFTAQQKRANPLELALFSSKNNLDQSVRYAVCGPKPLLQKIAQAAAAAGMA